MTATDQPTSAASSVQDAQALAAAVAERLPVATPGTPEPADWASAVAGLAGPLAVTARFTSAWTGAVAVAMPAAAVEAVAEPGQGADLSAAVAAALDEGLATGGPVVVEPATAVDADAAAASLSGDVAAVVLRGPDGSVLGVVAVGLASARRSGLPTQGGLGAPAAGGPALHLLGGVEMDVTVELGRTRMPIRELLSLAPGSLIGLDRAAGSPADILVNGRLIGRGEVVVLDEDYAVRITEIVPGADPTA